MKLLLIAHFVAVIFTLFDCPDQSQSSVSPARTRSPGRTRTFIPSRQGLAGPCAPALEDEFAVAVSG